MERRLLTFGSWCLETSTFEHYPRNNAVVDVLWESISHLFLIMVVLRYNHDMIDVLYTLTWVSAAARF